jgi:hypothetical protein
VHVKHILVGPPADELRSLLTTNLQTNLNASHRGWKLALVEYLQQTVSVSYDGIGGDVLANGAALDQQRVTLLESGRFGDYCRYVFRNSDLALRKLLPPPQHQSLGEDVAAARLEVELKRHVSAANPATSFNFWNRTRRFNATSPYGVFAALPTVYSPFLDHDLVAFLTSLPADVVLDRQFHDDVIRATYPQYKDLPYEIPRAPGMRNARHIFNTTRALTTYVLRNWPQHLVAPAFVVPRLAAGLACLGARPVVSWFMFTVIYLVQLEAIAYKSAIPVDPDLRQLAE